MKNYTKQAVRTVLALLLSGPLYASFVPAVNTRASMPATLTDVRERTAQIIKTRAEAGYHYASVDMDEADWATEKVIMAELRAAGYKVDFGEGRQVYGWNQLNGAIVVKW